MEEEEEKRNTMLLTVIAVATLLVAVVGATFAYFSLTAGGTSTTTGTVSTPKIGTATISAVNESLKLNLTAQDMAKPEDADKTFYATINGDAPGNATPISISKVELTGAEDGVTYECVTNVSVTVDGTMKDALEDGWAFLSLTGVNNASNIDINSIKTTGGNYTGKATVTSTEGTGSAEIVKAVLSFVNKYDAEQNDVAGKSLEVKITVTGGACTLQGE